MRIGLAVTEFPSASQTFVLDQACGLRDRGHHIDLHALKSGRLNRPHAGIERYRLLKSTYLPPAQAAGLRQALALLRSHAHAMLLHPLLSLHFLLNRSGYRLERLRLCISWFTRGRSYDLIHAHSGYNGMRLLPLYEAGYLRAPLVVTFHGHDVHAFLQHRPPNHYTPLFERASALVVCSDFMRRRLLELGAPVEKLQLIPNGIDLQQIPLRTASGPESKPLQLISIGRLVPFKGLQVLLAALALPSLRAIDLKLHIVGDGPLKAELLAQAEAAGLRQRVVFHGACAREQVLSLLSASDLYLAPAIVDEHGNTETQGVALLEAMACGLPVIASDVGGIPETVGAAAALVRPADPEALAKAIATWAASPDSDAGERGRQRVAGLYCATGWINALQTLYDRLVTPVATYN